MYLHRLKISTKYKGNLLFHKKSNNSKNEMNKGKI